MIAEFCCWTKDLFCKTLQKQTEKCIWCNCCIVRRYNGDLLLTSNVGMREEERRELDVDKDLLSISKLHSVQTNEEKGHQVTGYK